VDRPSVDAVDRPTVEELQKQKLLAQQRRREGQKAWRRANMDKVRAAKARYQAKLVRARALLAENGVWPTRARRTVGQLETAIVVATS
jgi:hypothetical protein